MFNRFAYRLVLLILLIVFPIASIYPNSRINIPKEQDEFSLSEFTEDINYDHLIKLLDDIESGKIENCSPAEQAKIAHFITFLAEKGMVSTEDNAVLEEDIDTLLERQENAFRDAMFQQCGGKIVCVPGMFSGKSKNKIPSYQANWFSQRCKYIRRFVHKHKKAIIIGAVVVVAATIIVAAVVVASSASAATAAARAAGAVASGPDTSEDNASLSDQCESKENSLTDNIVSGNESSALKECVDKHILSFKEFLAEDKISQEPIVHKESDNSSFGEKAREAGSSIAHQAYDEIANLIKVVPELCEEVKDLSSKFLPNSLITPNDENKGSPLENYEKLVAMGHEVIDKVFSTDQAEFFTPEAKANDPWNNVAIGILPHPQAVFKTYSDTSMFARAGKSFDRAGFTKAGRGLMKHGYREGGIYPKPLGNPAQVNAHGQEILESIINDTKRVIYERPHTKYGKVIEIVVPNKWGARFTTEYEFIGFLER